MASFDVEQAAFAGVGLIGRRPAAVFAWALVWVVFLVMASAPFLGMFASVLSSEVKTGGHAAPGALIGLIGGLFAWGLLMWIGGLCVGAVVQSAVIRAVLRPEEAAGAYLRIGREEAFVLAINFVLGLLFFMLGLLVSVIVGILFGFSAPANPAGHVALRLLSNIVVQLGFGWLGLRFSLAAPMSFSEQKFLLFESWTMTRGMDWRLIGTGVIVAVMVIVVYLLAAILMIGGGLAGLFGGVTSLRAFLTLTPDQVEPVLAPLLTLLGIVWLAAFTVITPIINAPWPHIYAALSRPAAAAAIETGGPLPA